MQILPCCKEHVDTTKTSAENKSEIVPGFEHAVVVLQTLCWWLDAAAKRDPQIAKYVATVAAAQDPEPLRASAVDRMIAILTDVAAHLRTQEGAAPADPLDVPDFLRRDQKAGAS